MNSRTLLALSVAMCLLAGGLAFFTTAPLEAQCLDRAACREIKAEVAKLRPDLRTARREVHKIRRELKALRRGSDRWLAKREEARDAGKTLRAIKRELAALQQDFRHQGCPSC